MSQYLEINNSRATMKLRKDAMKSMMSHLGLCRRLNRFRREYFNIGVFRRTLIFNIVIRKIGVPSTGYTTTILRTNLVLYEIYLLRHGLRKDQSPTKLGRQPQLFKNRCLHLSSRVNKLGRSISTGKNRDRTAFGITSASSIGMRRLISNAVDANIELRTATATRSLLR
jgi:hypothetical protein